MIVVPKPDTYRLLVRSVNALLVADQDPASFVWTVKFCSILEYATMNVTGDGGIECFACPDGGDCSRSINVAAQSIIALPGYCKSCGEKKKL